MGQKINPIGLRLQVNRRGRAFGLLGGVNLVNYYIKIWKFVNTLKLIVLKRVLVG